MDGRADYSSLLERERERLYHSSLAAGLGLFGAPGPDSSRAASLMRQQLSDLARTSTPLPPDPLAALHQHYLPPSLPLQAAAHSAAHPGVYPHYFPLLSHAESLSLYGPHALSAADHATSVYHRIYDLQKESLLAAGSLSALTRHAPSPAEGSTHTSPSPGLSSHGASSRQASTDVKHALLRPSTSRSLSRDSRKDSSKGHESRSKSESRRDRGPEQTTTLDLSRDRPCDLRVNTDFKKRHSVSEILRPSDKRESKRCESVPLHRRSPEPAGSRSRPHRASLQLDEPPLNSARTEDISNGSKRDGGFSSPPPSSRTEVPGGKGSSDPGRTVTSPGRGTGVTLYSKRKPTTEGKSGESSEHVDVGGYLVPHQQAIIAISRSPTAIGRGSPQEGGKVTATTFTPEVGTVAGWPSPPSQRRTSESSPRTLDKHKGRRTSLETKSDSSSVIRQQLSSPNLLGVVVKTRASPEGERTHGDLSTSSSSSVTVKTNSSPINHAHMDKDPSAVVVKTNLDSPEGASAEASAERPGIDTVPKVKVKSSLSPVLSETTTSRTSRDKHGFGTQQIKVETTPSCDKRLGLVKLENGSAQSGLETCLKASSERGRNRTSLPMATGREDSDSALNLSTSRHRKCPSVDNVLVQPKKEHPSPCKRTQSDSSPSVRPPDTAASPQVAAPSWATGPLLGLPSGLVLPYDQSLIHPDIGHKRLLGTGWVSSSLPRYQTPTSQATGRVKLEEDLVGLSGDTRTSNGGLLAIPVPMVPPSGQVLNMSLSGAGPSSSVRLREAKEEPSTPTAGSIPVGIAIARQREERLDDVTGSPLLSTRDTNHTSDNKPLQLVSKDEDTKASDLSSSQEGSTSAVTANEGGATDGLEDRVGTLATVGIPMPTAGFPEGGRDPGVAQGAWLSPAVSGATIVAPGGSGTALMAPGATGTALVAPGGTGTALVAPGGTGTALVAPGGPGAALVAPGGSGPSLVAPGGSGPTLVAPGGPCIPPVWFSAATSQPVATAIPVDPAAIPLRPPPGYKLAQDSLSGHLYFVPEAVLDSSRWPSSANHQPVVIGQPHIGMPPTLPPPLTAMSPPPEAMATSSGKRASPDRPTAEKWADSAEANVEGRATEMPVDVGKVELKQETSTPTTKLSPWQHKMRPHTLWMQGKEAQKGPKQAVVPPQREGLIKAGAGPPQATVAPQLPKATVAPQPYRKMSAESPATSESHLHSSQSTELGVPGRSSGRTGPSSDLAASTDAVGDPEVSRGAVHSAATQVLPSLPVTAPHAFPLVYPSAVPYLCDPSLLQRLPFAPLPPTSTQDRATSPIHFDLEPSTTSSSTATDDLISVQSSAVQTSSTPSQHQAIQTLPSGPSFCPRCRAPSSPSLQPESGNDSPPSLTVCSSPRTSRVGQSSPRPKGVADYLFDLSGPMLSQIEAEEDIKNLSQPESPCSSVSQGADALEDNKPRDLLSLIPQVSQVSDGLELLSILAEHAQKEQQGSQGTTNATSKTDADEDDGRDINRNYNAPKPSMLADLKPLSKGTKVDKQEVLEEYVQGGFRITAASIDGMDALELEMRMRLAELQRRYKEKQKELARLQPKKEKEQEYPVHGRALKRTSSKTSSRSDRSKSPQSTSTDSEAQNSSEPNYKKKKLEKKEPVISTPAKMEETPQKPKPPPVNTTPQKQTVDKATMKKKTPAKPVTSPAPVVNPPPAKLRASPSLALKARTLGKNSLFGGPSSASKVSPPIKPTTPIKSPTTNKFFGRSPLLSKTVASGKLKSPLGSNIQTKTDYGARSLKSPGGKPYKSGITSTVVSPSKFQKTAGNLFSDSQSKPNNCIFQKKIWKSENMTIPDRTIPNNSKFSLSSNQTNSNSSMFKTGVPFQRRDDSLPTNQSQKLFTKAATNKKPGEAGVKKITVKEELKDISDDIDSESSEMEDVSWLFDEDEINPPGFTDGESKTSGTSSSSSSTHTTDDSAPEANETWSMSSPHSCTYDSLSESGLGPLSRYGTEEVEVMRTSVAAATSAALKSKKRKKSPDDTGLDASRFYDNPVKRRKPGRPKKCGEEQSARGTETIVAKKPKYQSLLSMTSNTKTLKKSKPKTPSKETAKDKTEKESIAFLDEEWNIRRSERIFLNDPAVRSPTSESCSSLQGSKTKVKDKQSEKSPAKVMQELSQKVKKKYSKTGDSKSRSPSRTKDMKDTKDLKDEKVAKEKKDEKDKNVDQNSTDKASPYQYPSSLDSSDTDTSRDDDNVSVNMKERETTPEPRSCVLSKEELRDGLRVLYFNEGLFYEGQVKCIQPPDIYGVVIDGERGNRPHIMSREEILKEAIIDVRPLSARFVPQGARVCAYWSQQFSCLYPGTVVKESSTPTTDPNQIPVEFDDGDSGTIPVGHIRMLPQDYPIVDIEPNPLLVMGSKRRRQAPSEELALDCKEQRALSDISSCSQVSEDSKGRSPTKTPKKRTASLDSSINSNKKKGTTDSNNKTNMSSIPETDDIQTKAVKDKTLKVVEEPDPGNKSKSKSESSTSAHNGVDCDSSNSTGSILKTPKKKTREKKAEGTGKSEQGSDSDNLPPLLIDTTATSTPTPVPSNKSSPGSSVSTYSISPGSQAGLTMCIRTSSTEGLSEAAKCEDTESSSESSEGTVTSGSSDNSSSLDDASSVTSGSAGVSDSEDAPGGSAAANPPGKEASSDKNTHSVNKKSSPGTSAGCQKPKPRKERQLSGEKSKIAVTPAIITKRQPRARTAKNNANPSKQSSAFLPARQLWRWSGKGTKRPGMKGKAKKEYFKAIQRGKEMIRIGECAVFLSTGRPHLPFVGRLESLWEGWGGNMVVKVKWFYHPEETKGGKKLAEVKGALYESPHVDENDVQTISHKCVVESYSDYKLRKKSDMDNNDVYYLAGTYDPTIGMLTFAEDVKVL